MTLEQLIYDQFDFAQCPLECRTGWMELIYKMCVEIDDLYFYLNRECEMSILQCKEKFGSLRIYYNADEYDEVTDIIADIIIKYEQLSKSTCEICGAEGKLVKDGYWIKVRCEDCR